MLRRKLKAVACIAALYPLHASAQPPPPLRQAGALHCSATKAEGPAATALHCQLRLPDVEVDRGTFNGEMFGPGLHLVSPGGIQVVWNVLSTTTRLDPSMIAGEYDTNSKLGFRYAENNADLLIGGFNGVVALELVAPTLDAITPSTRLVLRQEK